MNVRELRDKIGQTQFGTTPVGIILPGHSVRDLIKNIHAVRRLGLVWGTVNRPDVAQRILDEAGLKLDFLISYQKKDPLHPDYIGNYSGPVINEGTHGGNTIFNFLVESLGVLKTIYLFGADGYSDSNEPYFDPELFVNTTKTYRVTEHRHDTEYLNANFPLHWKGTRIINVNPSSKYEPFPRISMDDLLEVKVR